MTGENAQRKLDQGADKFLKTLEAYKSHIKTLLLGPGFPPGELDIRLDVKRSLEQEGFPIFVMEELPDMGSGEIHEKFREIIIRTNPDLIICVFTEKGSPGAVLFELGYVCGIYGFNKTISRLKFCVHWNVPKLEIIPRYVEILMAKAECYDYYDDVDGRYLIDRVRTMIRSEVVRRYDPPDCPVHYHGDNNLKHWNAEEGYRD